MTALVQSQLAGSGLVVPDLLNEQTPPPEKRKGRSQGSLLASAQDWQARQRDHHGVELARDNLVQFLTTEALMTVLINK